MTDVLIRRDLLEDLRDAANDCLNHEIMRGNDRNVPAYTELVEQADAALSAPRQPDGEGLEVVAWLGGNGFHTEEKEATGAPFPLCHLSDARRAIAELREECEHLRACQENDMLHMTGLVATCERLRVFNKSLDEEASKLLQDVTEAENEAYTLRQQLAERDAEIERLRVKLMTIASAEPGRHNIEWAKAMAATGNNEAYAKWREAFDQRDKLADILRDLVPGCKWRFMRPRIDAALAEIDHGNE